MHRIYIGGYFLVNANIFGMAKWSNSALRGVSEKGIGSLMFRDSEGSYGMGTVFTSTMLNNNLYIGGEFSHIYIDGLELKNQFLVTNIAQWNKETGIWSKLGNGTGVVRALAIVPSLEFT
jgi:hypothetical protein